MNARRTTPIFLAAVVATVLSACAGSSGGTGGQAPLTTHGGLSGVALIGDSVASQEALSLGAALEASGVGFESDAEAGGGNVVGPFSDHSWKQLSGRIAGSEARIFVYQITTYDWGTEKVQAAAYRRLLDAVEKAGGELVFLTLPPIRPDDFYAPHLAELATSATAAQTVADGSGGKAVVLDTAAVWGPRFRQVREGTADRSSDGIHVCPQGAARFAAWLLDELEASHPEFEAAPPSAWANSGWSADDEFHGC